MSLGIALQLYTLREQAERDFVGMLTEVADAGYQAVEFAGFGGLSAATLRQVIDELGLRAISAHVGFRQFEADAAKVLDDLQVLGCSYAVVPGIPKELRGEASIPALVEHFNTWGDASKAAGLRFGYHNHGWELAPLGESTMLQRLAAGTVPSLVNMQLDVYWALEAGGDPVALLREFSGRIPTLHAKEMSKGDDKRDTTIGDGVTPWPEVVAAARQGGTDWLIVEQEDDPANAYRDIRRSLANLRELVASA